MKKILLTGSTDGIGLETAKMLASGGHHILMHGRNEKKLEDAVTLVSKVSEKAVIGSYVADLSLMTEVERLAGEVARDHGSLDVLINNAGVFRIQDPDTSEGLDARFAVNTIAPYLLTKRLLPIIAADGRVVNLSSAAQAPVMVDAFTAGNGLPDGAVYAMSKLAITMWTNHLAAKQKGNGPVMVSVNPASMLGSKMVLEAYGVRGGDLRIGADILCRAALSEEFEHTSGKYFDNDSGRFRDPYIDALDSRMNEAVANRIEEILKDRSIES